MTEPARVGLVLAGGFSTRFEAGEKTLATIAGRPLLAHAIDGVAPAVDGVVVSCREEQLADFRPVFDAAPVTVAPAPDPVTDRGPAAGVANALESVEASLTAVVAGDMPFVDAAFLEELFDRLATAEGEMTAVTDAVTSEDAVTEDIDPEAVVSEDAVTEAVVPEADGYPQPTHAVYRTDALRGAAERALDDGDGSLQNVLDHIDVTAIDERTVASLTPARTFFDVNTGEDLREARGLVGNE